MKDFSDLNYEEQIEVIKNAIPYEIKDDNCFLTGSLIKEKPPPPMKWIVRGLLPEGSCLLLGAEMKTGKTWFTLGMALSIVLKRKFFNHDVIDEDGVVLFYSREGSVDSLSRRVWKMAIGLGIDPRILKNKLIAIEEDIDLNDDKQLEKMTNTVKKYNPILTIYDPLVKVQTGIDENSTDMKTVLRNIRAINDINPRSSTLVVHHTNKIRRSADGEMTCSPMHSMRGSTVITSWCDGLIFVNKESENDDSERIVSSYQRDKDGVKGGNFSFTINDTIYDKETKLIGVKLI